MAKSWRKQRWVVPFFIFSFLLGACGTFEVGLEPGVTPAVSAGENSGGLTVAQDPAPTETTAPSVPTPIPTVTGESAPVPTLIPTPEPEVATLEPSPLWIGYRDPYYGYGLALPCYWVIYPGVPDQPSAPGIRSYDEWFFLNRSQRGQWKDAIVPEGAFKFDIHVHEGSDPSLSLSAAVDAYLSQQAANSEFAPEIAALEEVSIGPHAAVRITRVTEGDSPYDLIVPDQTHAFRLSPENLLLVTVSPRQALESPEVQHILASLVLSQDEEIVFPSQPPGGPLEGREIYQNEESGYCFSYPSEYALETYEAGSPSFIGEVASLKLERPLYTVGMIVKSWRVGEQATLAEQVDNYLLQFADRDAIERNGTGWYALRLDGRAVEVLDGVPGSVTTLDVFALDEGRMIQLTTSPTMTGHPESADDVSLLFGVVTTTFTFIH